MTITAPMVKELRERTGAGMMECKKALQETSGDIEQAITEMRKRGQAKAAKRASKTAAEGLVVIKTNEDGKQAVLVEVNCETDFVARDANFTGFIDMIAARALATGVQDVDAVLALALTDGADKTIEKARQELVTKIGENVKVRRVALLQSTGIVGAYQHGGRIGVLVALNVSDADLAKDVAMHIAASSPEAINESDVPAELIEKEREIFIAQAKESGKKPEIIEKMVTGRIAKFLKATCLVGQSFIKDPSQTIGSLLAAKNAQVTAMVRFEVGEGIEKAVVDFAEEVKAQVQGG